MVRTRLFRAARRPVVAVALALALAAVGCSAAPEEAVRTGGQAGSAAAATAAASSPVVPSTVAESATTTTRATTVPTTEALPPNLPRGAGQLVIVHGPGNPPGPTTTTIPRRPPPPGVTTHGSGDLGWSTITTSGSTTVDLRLYPADVYLDEALQVGAGVTFTGSPRAVRLDWGDGTSYVATEPWRYMPCTTPVTRWDERWLVNYVTHTYGAAGTYTVTATITVADCIRPAELSGPGALPPLMLPNGQPIGEPIGHDSVVTASLTAEVHPEARPRVVHVSTGAG